MARHYDALLDVVTFGRYAPFIARVVGMMEVSPRDKILDLGAGTGRNACLMMKYLSQGGELVGMDISEEMIEQFQKKCTNFPNARIIHARIDRSLPLREKFDKAFISFVLHGFPQNVRETVVKKAFELLKDGGAFFILDYNEFTLEEMPFYLRGLFELVECPYAFDFIEKDWQKILTEIGFDDVEEYPFFKYVRLLKATK